MRVDVGGLPLVRVPMVWLSFLTMLMLRNFTLPYV